MSEVIRSQERGRSRRVGHKGADHIAPGNTAASFDAALAHGVDMIEFDVLSEHQDGTGELYLAHDYGWLWRGGAMTLEEGLRHLAGDGFASVELDVDLKLPGYERRVVDALRRHGLVERALASTMEVSSLAVLREIEPALRLGWSVPKLRNDPFRSRWKRVPATAIGIGYRAALPRRAAAAIRAGRIDALMAHWRLVSRALVRQVHAAGGELYVWTVDDAALIRRLEALGVDGVITNDPRLFVEPDDAPGR
jgi:glycerophosphoryl diester phosphodiesterase